jgi:TonB family protein
MFETMLAEDSAGQAYRRAGMIASFLLHEIVLVGAFLLPSEAGQAAPKLAPPPPPVVAAATQPGPLTVVFHDPVRATAARAGGAKAACTPTPQALTSPPLLADPGCVVGGSAAFDDEGGTTGPGPKRDMAPVSQAAVWPSEGMKRPVRIAGADPTYTPEALRARIEGKVLTKCTITTSGTLRNCRIIKGLPHLDRAVLKAISAQRYTPVLFEGRPTAVEYIFVSKFLLPNEGAAPPPAAPGAPPPPTPASTP